MPVGRVRGMHALLVSAGAMLFALAGCTISKSPSLTATAMENGSGLQVGEYYFLDGVRYYDSGAYSHVEVGEASWYGSKFHGNTTANGETYDRHALTAAHPSLDLPSIARVTNLENGRSVVVRINDRGPYVGDRIIDVSEQAARRLAFIDNGVTRVRVEVLPEETNLATRVSNGDSPVMVADSTAPVRRGTDALVRGRGSAQWVQAAAASGDPEAMDAIRSGMIESNANTPQRYYVEAGAFLIRENAERVVNEFDDALPVRVMARLVDGNWIYRLQAGPHRSRQQAENARSQLHGSGHRDAIILRN